MNFRPIQSFKAILGIDKPKINIFPPDFNQQHIDIIQKVKPYTMTTPERLFGLIESVKYVIANNIPGAFVECGVWKGGSMMAIAETLLQLGVTDRKLYLFDTFEGMTTPTIKDVDIEDRTAVSLLHKDITKKNKSFIWANSGLEDVKRNISKTNYPSRNIFFIKGDILQTIPINSPGDIALLRLDTDWYESTKHELNHLYPLLYEKGILIIDDYGHWKGSKEAVDEYIKEKNLAIMLHRLDYTGRCAIKLSNFF